MAAGLCRVGMPWCYEEADQTVSEHIGRDCTCNVSDSHKAEQ